MTYVKRLLKRGRRTRKKKRKKVIQPTKIVNGEGGGGGGNNICSCMLYLKKIFFNGFVVSLTMGATGYHQAEKVQRESWSLLVSSRYAYWTH